MEDAKVHGQDGEQDQEFGEEGFWFFIKKKKATMAPLSLGVDHSSPPKEAPCPRASQSLFIRAKGRRRQLTEKEEESKARRSNSTTGLDRVQTEETQLDRAEGRVDLEEPLFENPGFEYDPTPTKDFLRATGPLQHSSKHSSTKAKGATHTSMKKRKKRSRKLDRVTNPVEWSAPDGRLPSPDHDLASQFFGGH
ncbi:unnamed protein product [Microthlaspi erraticum]|uniref:Uncharacterized protein n=1 Tax=Microthlaspi erraticum TaxID=1685480 RepID=A0A6D2K4Y4_9BRAS|nr:unnamed protein product [Microthlaspi erraticum]